MDRTGADRGSESYDRSLLHVGWMDYCIASCAVYGTYIHTGTWADMYASGFQCVRYLQDVVHYQQKRIIIIKKKAGCEHSHVHERR